MPQGSPSRRWVLPLVVCLAFPFLARAQRPVRVPSSEGVKALAAVDARFYRAVDHGLVALQFSYRPKIQLRGAQPFRVRYTWRKGAGDRVDYLTTKGELVSKPPSPFEKQGPFFLATGRSFGRLFLGERLVKRFKHCSVRVVKKRVNLREETQLILEPRVPKNLRRLRITLNRDGLPWKWERTLLNGHERLEEHAHSKRRDGAILSKMKVIMGSTRAGDKGVSYAEDISWQKVKGFLLPATIVKKEAGLKAPLVTKISFLDVRVNEDVPAQLR